MIYSGCAERLRRTSLCPSNSLISGKIQGIFADLAAKAGRRLGFPTMSQLVTPKFPTHLNREFCAANRELFPAEQGKSLAKSPADGIFGRDSEMLDFLIQRRRDAQAARKLMVKLRWARPQGIFDKRPDLANFAKPGL